MILALVTGSLSVAAPAGRSATPAMCSASVAKGRIAASPGAGVLSMSDADLNRELTAARDAGMWAIRVDVDWSVIEARRGIRAWTAVDRVVGAVTALGMCPVGVVGYTPRWAARATDLPTDSHFRPADPATFAAFARDAAARYVDSIAVWEVWNEPNIATFYRPAPDAAGYGRLLTAASAAIKSASPTSAVISGGLAPAVDNGRDIAPVTFLTALYRGGFRRSFDAVGVHPYTYPALPDDPSTRSWNTAQKMWDMHDVMVAGGDGAKLIWMTEFGAPTGTAPTAVSDEVQAETIRIVVTAARDVAWLGPAFVYSLRDSGTDPADPEQNFGLLRRDFTPKAAYGVVRGLGGR